MPLLIWPDVRVYGANGQELTDWGRDRYVLEVEDHLEERRRRRAGCLTQ